MAAGRRRGGQPPARNLRCAVARRANHLRAGAHPGQRHAGRDQPAGRRRRRRAQGRPRVAGRTGRARPRAPGRLERLAGRDDRRAAPGMAAGWRRRRQPPARNLRRAGPGRAAHLRTDAGPGQRHAGGNQPPGRRRRRRAQAALALQGELAARDRERLDAWSGSLAEMVAALRQEWQQAGADAASRQREICDALLLAAQDISEQGRAQASGTLAEINRLVDAAAEAPKAAVAPAGRAGGPRPGPPGRVDRHAGRDGRNAAPGMAAGRRRCRQPPAADLRGAGRHRPPDLGSIAPTPATRWPRSTA